MGETQTPNFYDFWIFEPVIMPQNQYCLSLGTPVYSNKIEKIPRTFSEHICFIKCRNLAIQYFDNLRKDGHRTIPKIRLIKS